MPNKQLSDRQVAEEVRALVKANRIQWSRHAEQRMAERGIDKGMVKECLKKGQFAERPTNPNRAGAPQYAFRMETSIDQVDLAVAAALVPSTKVVVITVIAI